MKKLVILLLLVGVIISTTGCFSGAYGVPTDEECHYKCSKCGRYALMLSSYLKREQCSKGGNHNWRYNL